MPFFSKVMMRLSPRVLRSIRIQIFLPIRTILESLPPSGRILDVGCGYGHVLSYLAERRPDLSFIGTDTDEDAIRQARTTWKHLRNLQFESLPVEKLTGDFTHALLLDVIHHMTREQESATICAIAMRMVPGGSLLIKEMDAGNCDFGVFLDTYVSRCPPRVRIHEDLAASLSPLFSQVRCETGRKAGIGYVNVHAVVSN